MTSPRTILFDLDHTLIDTDGAEARSLDDVLAHAQLPLDPWADRYRAINTRLWAEVEAGTRRPDDVKEERFRRLLEDAGSTRVEPADLAARFADGFVRHAEFFPGTEAVLDALRAAGCVLGLVTNGIGSIQRGRIDRLGLDRWFDAYAISGELGVAKPDPAIFDIILRELADPPRAEVVMVGDNPTSDIEGGRRAGVRTVLFDPAGRHDATLADQRIRSLEELVD